MYSQNNFVNVHNGKFYLNNQEFKFLGMNCTYLFQYKLFNKESLLDSVFSELKKMNVGVIRVVGHSELNNQNSIRSGPHNFNEEPLKSLDYLINKAAGYNIKLIIVLCDNWNHYGGIDAYLKWGESLNKQFVHDDFFIDDTLRSWYKYYIEYLLNRTNFYSNIKYKDDSTIFAWELINEPRSSDKTGKIIFNWTKMMSEFIKSIDNNHLVGIGEEGFDIDNVHYSNENYFYGGNSKLFNGYYGVSFVENQKIETLDYANIHSYSSGYDYHINSTLTWIEDHSNLARKSNKPLLIGEYGTTEKKVNKLKNTLDKISKLKNANLVYWQYIHQDEKFNDGYGINWFEDYEYCNTFLEFSKGKMFEDSLNNNTEIAFLNNFPNPFSSTTIVRFNLKQPQILSFSLYNILGKETVLVKEKYYNAGLNELVISLNKNLFSCGLYILKTNLNNKNYSKKILYIR